MSRMSATRITCFALSLAVLGCGGGNAGRDNTIQVGGSDTMVNVAQKWAEVYTTENPSISVQVSGGGSGVGIAGLMDGELDMANASRSIKNEERELVQKNLKKDPSEHVVGRDALAVYVHKDNPLSEISLPQLAAIYGEDGKITKWSQLGIKVEGDDEIIRVSRQNSSGTYVYFREAVLGKKGNYKQGAINQSGSKDVVDLVSTTPSAIGYSGMGYATDQVKMLSVSRTNDDDPVEPTEQSAASGDYPIARPLLIYTIGQPSGALKTYLDWILSQKGQKIVSDLGYVPIN
ncbi:MAG: phosphate ABC transporter substrate-binding protein [Planctomycetota bacterium]|nr:phosphate ABC transporter substrate-binding protein [Planctomycetota bacterium]